MDINDQSIEDILNVLNYLRDETARNSITFLTIRQNLDIIKDQIDHKANLLYDQQESISKYMQNSLYDIVKYTHISSMKLQGLDKSLWDFKKDTHQLLFRLLLTQKESGKTWSEFQSFYETSQKSEAQQAAKQEKQTASKFKALTSSILTKQDFVDYDVRKAKREKIDAGYRSLSKYEKQNLKEQQMLNSKMGDLLKDVRDDKKKEGGGLMKILGPFVLLFGGIAALAYGMMKFPLVRRMFNDLKGSRLGTTIAGFINKIKPHDKTIKEWLRGLPFIGNLFDIYDGFQQLFQGNIKQGIKHFAFAIPGAEWLATMIGSSKQEMLKPGGFQKAWQGFSLQKVWSNVKTYFNDTFIAPITNVYNSIAEAFQIMTGGTRGDLTTGLMMLAEDFPAIAPVARFISGMVGKVFDVTLGALDIDKPADWPKFDEQTIGGVFTKIYEGMSGFMTKIMDVFGQIGTFVGHFANVFSDDYGKQSAALNAIDEMSPSIGGMLRTVLGLVDNFKNAGIEEGDNAFDAIKKLTAAAFKGTAQGKFGRQQTIGGEMGSVVSQLESLDKDKDKEKVKELERRLDVLNYRNRILSGQEALKTEETMSSGLNQRIQQPGAASGVGGMMGAGYAGSALLAGIPAVGPYLAAGGAAITTGLGIGLGGTAVASDLWKRGDYQKQLDESIRRKVQAKKDMYEQWMKYGREMGEEPPEEILDLIKQDINAGILPDSILQIKKKVSTSAVNTGTIPKIETPKVSIPTSSNLSPEQLMSEISKRYSDQQAKLAENTKYLSELYLLLQRMYPDVAAIKDSNVGMLQQGPGNVTSLVQGGTNYTFGSRESGYMRSSLSPQWGTP